MSDAGRLARLADEALAALAMTAAGRTPSRPEERHLEALLGEMTAGYVVADDGTPDDELEEALMLVDVASWALHADATTLPHLVGALSELELDRAVAVASVLWQDFDDRRGDVALLTVEVSRPQREACLVDFLLGWHDRLVDPSRSAAERLRLDATVALFQRQASVLRSRS